MLGYRTVLTADKTDDNIGKLLEVLSRWVVKKKQFPSMPAEGAVENSSGAVLTVSSSEADSAKGLRWQLVEEWDPPQWSSVEHSTRTAVTHITLAVTREVLWFWVDIEPPTLSERDRTGRLVEATQPSGTPRFVAEILEAIEMRDGLAEPRSGLHVIPSASGIDNLVDIVQDTARIEAICVTSPPADIPMDEWVSKSEKHLYAMQGLAVGYVLSQDALSEFNRRTPFGHSVPTGGIRTFLPGADLSDPTDAINHRLMLASTIREFGDQKVSRILRSAQVKRLRGIRLPRVLREVDYEFLRKRRMQPFDVLHQIQPETKQSLEESKPDFNREAAQVADLRQRLADAEELAEEALKDISQYQEESADAHEQSELDQLEMNEYYLKYSQISRENEKLKARIDYLRSELIKSGSSEAAWSDNSEVSGGVCPATFGELVDRLGSLQHPGELSGIRFTGDPEEVRDLDEYSQLGEAAVAKAWDALITLDSYVQMRDSGSFEHSFSTYVKNGAHGGVVRIGKVVWTEGQTTKTGKLGEQRKFPVDQKVDPSGKKLMVTHVKLSNLKGVAPRMYFDDTYSAVGYVTIGYLGSHLDNTMTN